MNRSLLTAALVAALTLAGCAGQPAPEPVRTPSTSVVPLEEAARDGLWLPHAFEDASLLEAPWDHLPAYSSGVFLGSREGENVRVFTAVDVTGRGLWTVERPLRCEDAVLTATADGRAVAVLTDAPTGATECTSLSGYDLASGNLLWGPLEAGPLRGPGLVATLDGDAATLDGATGLPRASEGTILGEFDGLVLTSEGTDLSAHGPDGQELWRLGLAGAGLPEEPTRSNLPAPEGFAFVGVGDGAGALVDLSTGDVLSTGARQAVLEPASRTLVLVEASGMRGLDATGAEIWAESLTPGAWISAAGGVFLYVRDGEAVRVHNAVSGAVAEGYGPDGAGTIVVPAMLTVEHAAVLWAGEDMLFAPVPAGLEQPVG